MAKPSLILRLYSCISEYDVKWFIIFESKVLVINSKTDICTSLYPAVLFPILILLHKTFGTIYCLARSKSITPFHIVQYTTLNVFFHSILTDLSNTRHIYLLSNFTNPCKLLERMLEGCVSQQ